MARRWVAALCAAWLAAAVPLAADAQRSKTPEAKSFEVWVDDAEHLIVGIVEIVPGTEEGVGFTIRCERASRLLEGAMAFRILPGGQTRPGGRPLSFRPGRKGSGRSRWVVRRRDSMSR